ncbi:MAG: DUF2520 domain-containing protein [Bacteroidales bacterium]|nr:DUF2520 domain-containing protein [Bacteroidales bacterium]
MNLLKNKIVLVGAGNVATQLGQAFQEKGFSIVQVYSRTTESARELASLLDVPYTTDIHHLRTDADVYIFSVKDSVLPELLKELPPLQGLLVHTAGSLPLTIFESGSSLRYGVFYPLQTFSKKRKISFKPIPIFIEANLPEDEKLLDELASSLSEKVVRISSEERKHLHLAAVFACNFVNHMYTNAAEILEDNNLSKDYLLPLIEETASKIKEMHPKEAQTGPAVRYDTNVMDKHLELLKERPEKYHLYQFISKSIYNSSNQK